jgi:hypothetical protein
LETALAYSVSTFFGPYFSKGGFPMEPRKQDLEQTLQSRPEEKKRRFRLVKLEEQRFRMDKLEERIAPKSYAGHDTGGRFSIE